MAIITTKQLSELVGKRESALHVYKSRGVIVEHSKGMYNTEKAQNKLFIEKWQRKNTEKVRVKLNEESEEKIKDIPDIQVSTTRLKYLQAIKTEKEISKLTLDINKKQGEVIPYNLIKPIFLQHNQSLMYAFKNAIDAIVLSISKEAELDVEQIARITKSVIENINEAMVTANDVSQKSIDIVINTYSDARGVGEHD